jgi:hypothetical protein
VQELYGISESEARLLIQLEHEALRPVSPPPGPVRSLADWGRVGPKDKLRRGRNPLERYWEKNR